MRKIMTVAGRDLFAHLRKPGFYLTTLGVPLMFAILLYFTSKAGGNTSSGVPTLIDEPEGQPFGYVDLSGTIARLPPDISAELARPFASEQQGQAALQQGEISVLYVLPADYRASGHVLQYSDKLNIGGGETLPLLRVILLANLLPAGQARLAPLLEEPMSLKTVALSEQATPQGDGEDEGLSMILPMSFGILLALSIFMSSGLLLQAVIEEKESHTIEVLLSSVTPRKLLVGKVLGLGLLGLLQMIVWLSLARLLVGPGAQLFSVAQAIQLSGSIWLLALLYFLLGYTLFAVLMAGIGAVSNSMRESSQLSVVIMLPAALPLMLQQPLIVNPEGGLATALSLFPLTAPTTMMLRLTSSRVPGAQVALSLLLLALAIVLAIWAAGKLFRATNLLQGKRLSLREIGRALRG